MLSFFAVPIAKAADVINALDKVNPLGEGRNLIDIINMALSWLIWACAMIAPIIIIWGAYQIMMSQGDTEKVLSGRKAILYTVIGFIIILASKGIVDVVKGAIGVK